MTYVNWSPTFNFAYHLLWYVIYSIFNGYPRKIVFDRHALEALFTSLVCVLLAIVNNFLSHAAANAYQIKHIPGRKTDTLDSEWIAEVC